MQIQQVQNPKSLFLEYKDPRIKTMIVGMSLCGKSTIGKYIQRIRTRNIIIDKIGEYHEPYINDVSSMVLFLEQNKNKNFNRMVFRSKGMSEKERYFAIDKISKAIYAIGNIHLVVEEAHEYCTPHNIPDNFAEVFSEGRHNFCGATTTTQRISGIHPLLRGQSRIKFCGQLDEETDLKAASNVFINCREEILNLQQYEFLHKSQNIISKFKTDSLV